ncbi:hypothetical protein OsJ_32695 [Oryza sativa Japonica Group]|uniref:Uncharacterized protein n=1 Tax=Oryza sativa subsp. japonica TaxID=39947 RepID=A3C7X4_ORYSJ|nr:hypothetical protein OsJ_32695 [Oryza sativa Japonica Group]
MEGWMSRREASTSAALGSQSWIRKLSTSGSGSSCSCSDAGEGKGGGGGSTGEIEEDELKHGGEQSGAMARQSDGVRSRRSGG